jgi:phytoene dehydrogenase-like protein
VEQAHGVWYVNGGIGRLRDALVSTATSMGVDVRTGVEVGRISSQGGAVSGVEFADGGSESAEVVVSDVDAAHLYVDLLPDPKQAKQLDKAGPSASAFVLCAAVRGRTEGIAHHNVFFPLHDRQEFQFLEAGQLPVDQTIHASVSAVTDPGQAPPDCENWYVLVTTPPAIGIDRKLMTAGVLNRLAERGVDLRDRIEFTRTLLPADIDARYRAPGGAIHGTSANGKRAAFSRPSNVGPVDGLYLVGGSAHPGGGLPLVATGARIVADLVADRYGDS